MIEYIPFAGRACLLEVDHDDMTITWWMHAKRYMSKSEVDCKLDLARMIFAQNQWHEKGYRLIGDDLRQFQSDIAGFEVSDA